MTDPTKQPLPDMSPLTAALDAPLGEPAQAPKCPTCREPMEPYYSSCDGEATDGSPVGYTCDECAETVPPPPATGTPARTLADELHDLAMSMPVNGQSFRAAINCGKIPAIIYKIGHRDACYDIAVALAAHPALRQPAPVAADGAGRGEQMWAVVLETIWRGDLFSHQREAEHFAAAWLRPGARVVPVRVSVLADDAGAAGADGWKRKAEEVGAAYADLLLTHPGLLEWAVKASGTKAEGIAERIMLDFKGRLAPRVPGQVLETLGERIERELRAVMLPQEVADAAAKHAAARAALAAPAGGAAGRDGKA
jgi:hypothetical protein